MAKAIINKARRLLGSIADMDDADREEFHDLLDEAEEASDDGQDISRSMERITSRINKAKEKADASKDKSGKGGQPKPPGKKESASTEGAEDNNGKKEATHGSSRIWFGA